MKVPRAAEVAPLAATAATAIAYRLLYLHQLRQTPAFLEPVLDGAAHLEWARGLLGGTWPPAEAFFRAPGYVFLLAAELAGLGDDAQRVAVFQLMLGVITPVLTAALAGRLFGREAAWIAGIGAAVYPMLAFFDAQLLPPVLAVPLALAAALVSLGALERGGTARGAAAGMLWGAAGVVRAPLLLGGAVLAAFLLGGGGASSRGTRVAARGRKAALALGVALLLPLAVTVRNAAVGDPAFLASQGGLNLYLGNNGRANGLAATFPDDPTALGYRMIEAAERIAERDEGRPLRSAEVSAYWTRRTLRDIGEAPGRWLALMAKKAILFWSEREIPNNHDPALFAERIALLRWSPGWMFWAPVGVLGLAYGRRRWEVRFTAAVVGMVWLAAAVFFVNARFRVPAVPFLVALGAGGVTALFARIAAGRMRAVAMGAGLLTVVALVVRWNPFRIPREPWPLSYVLAAEAESARGEHVRALRWIEIALEREPGLYAGRVAQIDLLRATGRVDEAKAVAERAVAALPTDPALRDRYGVLLDLGGDPAGALEQIEAALRIDPAYAAARVNRGVVLARLGETERAKEALREVVREAPGSAEAARATAVLRGIEVGELVPVQPGGDGAGTSPPPGGTRER